MQTRARSDWSRLEPDPGGLRWDGQRCLCDEDCSRATMTEITLDWCTLALIPLEEDCQGICSPSCMIPVVVFVRERDTNHQRSRIFELLTVFRFFYRGANSPTLNAAANPPTLNAPASTSQGVAMQAYDQYTLPQSPIGPGVKE